MPSVAIVGGGFAGTLLVEALDEKADIVLIDPREAFVNVSASLRALTQPDFAPRAFFRYGSLLRRGRQVQDYAASVDATGVTLRGGGRVETDFTVLATGSSYSYPARPHRHDSSIDEALDDLRATHGQLAQAERVLILGAGPVGLELAGEIREVWPHKRIVVVDPDDELLRGYLPEVRDELRRQLQSLDIDVRLGVRIDGLPPVAEGVAQTFAAVTEAGEEIAADIWFRSFGSRVNTAYLEDGALVALDHGLVPVTASLTVAGHDHVYAVGDITNLPDPKMATWAQTQALTVVENLTARIEGRPAQSTYVPSTAQTRRIFLPLGSTGGVGQIPGPDGASRPAPLDMVVDRKGRDLFTARMAARFHA
ncbi:NAD(P)/FAD-dependent oxidoreductase [Nocardioides acrostichi]|uniref:FAD-dependent oxidoreductase n=1 Tax=Nocardioides acrostichi TaxID=2784339 RepID=A0A930UU59_9ACTN|nr:FAD-dependent oxidoreductase [Nocardioides acrostichi]MBF4160241.1 FAD-dependent oxidoreductase [Nocardioides acrostichi]